MTLADVASSYQGSPMDNKAPRPIHDHKWDDYHDPTAGIGGAAPARSALTVRLILAGSSVVVYALGALASAAVLGMPGLAVVLAVLAAVGAIDVVVVVHRKRRGEPG